MEQGNAATQRLAGRRILVTSASTYMGPAIAELFRSEGADVITDDDSLIDPSAPAELIARCGPLDAVVAKAAKNIPVSEEGEDMPVAPASATSDRDKLIEELEVEIAQKAQEIGGALDRAAGGLEYVEQPCAGVEDLALVRRRVDVPGVRRQVALRRGADSGLANLAARVESRGDRPIQPRRQPQPGT